MQRFMGQTLIAISAIFIVLLPTPVILAKTDWSKSSTDQGQTAKGGVWEEFGPRKGKPLWDRSLTHNIIHEL